MSRPRIIGLAILALSACDDERKPPSAPPAEAQAMAAPWAPPAELPVLVTDEPVGAAIQLGGTQRHPSCWETFENEGEVANPFPIADRIERAEHFASCGVEALQWLDDGAFAVAWGSPTEPGSKVSDLLLGVWESNGTLRYSAKLDRSRQASNWTANFRRSFIASLPPRHMCTGTLWEGDTQVMCVDPKSGEPNWRGSMPFWSGIEPQPLGDGLAVADLSALTKRYPFTGEEMRHRKLEGLGGRAGYYSTDGSRLYFAPSRIDAPPLIAYDLTTFDEIWRTPLPDAPSATTAHAFKAFKRLLVKVDDDLFALDSETGKIAWGYEVSDDAPSIDADDDTIFVLSRRPDVPNRLTALDPATGKRKWSSDTPSGTLRVKVVDNIVFIGSVRAVQQVIVPDGAGNAP